MSKAILRRSNSKAGLQTLLKVTAQRSMEDAEEVERERRRRARESFRRSSSGGGGGGPGGECSQDNNGTPAEDDHDSTYDSSLKPSGSPSLEEDEGFSDWTQRREKRRQQRMQELGSSSQEPDEEEKRRQQRMQELDSQEPEEEKHRQQRMQELDSQEPGEEEKRRQQRMQELDSQEPEEEKHRQQRMQELDSSQEGDKVPLNGKQTTTTSVSMRKGALQDKTAQTATTTTTMAASKRLHRQQKEQEEEEKTTRRTSSERRKEPDEEEAAVRGAEQARREKAREEKTREEQRRAAKKVEELQKSQAEVEKRKEVKVSYTSKVFLHQEAKPSHARDASAREDVMTSCNNNKSKTPAGNRTGVQAAERPEAVRPVLETEQRLEKIRRSHQEKESQELEQLRQRQAESEQELGELKTRREERRRVREDEERHREEEEQQRSAKEEEEKRRMKGDMEKRRQEAAERMRMFSSTSVDGDEMTLSPFSPKTPVLKKGNEEVLTAESTCSITERTQSLNRSLKKSNSFKKTHPPVLLTKIDDKREQYTHAVENSQEAKAVKQGVMDIPSPPEAVSSKKNLFEGGEVWTQSPAKGTSCKDTEDLKVGVADLITQWVKGNPDGSGKQSLSRPADVKPGDVMNKKNMWEGISDTSGRTGQRTIGTPAGKKYKFVVTGHGKYEKKKPAAADENGEEYPNGRSDLCQDDY